MMMTNPTRSRCWFSWAQGCHQSLPWDGVGQWGLQSLLVGCIVGWKGLEGEQEDIRFGDQGCSLLAMVGLQILVIQMNYQYFKIIYMYNFTYIYKYIIFIYYILYI